MSIVEIGVKSDPIEYRYSFGWLFGLMREHSVGRLQLGSSFELFSVEKSYLHDLRRTADSFGVEIRSCFTSHRELGGFLSGDRRLETVARENYERWIDVAVAVGARYCGSNPGSVYRDQLQAKGTGLACYQKHMHELVKIAHRKGLEALLIEPMSCSGEPPSYPDEIESMVSDLAAYHEANPDETSPVYLCSDVTHGVADENGEMVHAPFDLFLQQIPYMAEFHFKNTDSRLEATFGFGPREIEDGIVDLRRLAELIRSNSSRFPVPDLTGYLELPGPKLGRERTDRQLGRLLEESITALKSVFHE